MTFSPLLVIAVGAVAVAVVFISILIASEVEYRRIVKRSNELECRRKESKRSVEDWYSDTLTWQTSVEHKRKRSKRK